MVENTPKHATCDHNSLDCGVGAPNVDLHCDLPGPFIEISASLLSGHFTLLLCVLCSHTVNFRVFTSVFNMQRLFGNC